ncbi:MAG: ATP-binding protein [Candidatus Krumholzibacteriia bacterium]|nr:ATP-binding protein [Candidatus Latescibacterota bacterium]
MRSLPTDIRSSEAAPLALYLWGADDGLSTRFLEELRPEPGRLRALPTPERWMSELPTSPFGVVLAAASEAALPAQELLDGLRVAGARLVLLLPACDERAWRRLLARGFAEVLTPPFRGLDLELLFADGERALPLDRRLPEFDQKVRTRVDFELPAELRFVAPAAGFLCRMAREHGFHPRVWAENLPLALDEALSNAIRHGCGCDAAKRVQVQVRFGHDVLRIRIEDPGAGFDPGTLIDPASEEGLHRGGGRGVLLMQELADRVEYQEGGRVVLLYLRRAGR